MMPSFLNPQWMLLYGVILSFLVNKESGNRAQKYSKILLQMSIVLLGANLKIREVLEFGGKGFIVTFVSIVIIFIIGYGLRRLFNLERTLSLLITCGTAICGGSAIAAVSPLFKSSGPQIGLAMGVVFLLNGISVFIFPPLGHFLGFNQADFGLFSALAIHDTSSVVAASSLYGEEAMKLATTYKLTRALWIIPLTIIFSITEGQEGVETHWMKRIKVPDFIQGFVLISLLFSFVSILEGFKFYFVYGSKIGLSLTLFLIGLGMNIGYLKESGLKPILFGVVLWGATILSSYLLVLAF